MDGISDLLCAGLIEKDTNGDVLWTWAYPTIRADMRNLMLRKCGLQSDGNFGKQINFIYGHHQKYWYYLHTTEVFEADCLPKVKQFVLVLVTRDINPEKYDTLCRIMSKTYCKNGNPTALVKVYLSVVTQGSCSTEENGTFMVQHFEQKRSFANVGIKGLINMFKLETILIYTAILLKKRVIVYHHKLDSLLEFIRVLPAFVWHRQNWNILYPFVDLGTNEANELKEMSCYAAGFLDASVEARTDLYDIFINLAATEISLAPHSKDCFTMTKTHKEIALFMIHCAEDEELGDRQVIKEIAGKTRDLLSHLKSLFSANIEGKSHSVFTIEKLREHKLAPALENFLINLAIAENLIDIKN